MIMSSRRRLFFGLLALSGVALVTYVGLTLRSGTPFGDIVKMPAFEQRELPRLPRVRHHGQAEPRRTSALASLTSLARGLAPAPEAGADAPPVRRPASNEFFEVVFYRILGNDLPPRHQVGQVYTNVEFILENEMELPGWRKRWVLNRIINQTEYRKIRQLLASHGYGEEDIIDIPFNWDVYGRTEFNYDNFPSPDYFDTVAFGSLHVETKNMAIDHLYHDKNLYAINNNGARNAALRAGKKTSATWILPFDGNCYVTTDIYERLNEGFREYEKGNVQYLVVPMARLLDNAYVLDETYRPKNAREEPQVAFRHDSQDEFDENFRYGRRPKVEFLWRLKYVNTKLNRRC